MVVIYDLETLKNFFIYVDVNLKGEFQVFECSEFKNDLPALRLYLKGINRQVGFNNVGFDAQVQEHIIKNYKKLNELPGSEIASNIHDFAQSIISLPEGEWPPYGERDFSIKQADLFKIWHYNNKARSCSLKWLQYSMDWHNIEDMPISHNSLIKDRKTADEVISYCKNDCLSTKAFFEITRGQTENELYKGIDKFQLRKDIKEQFEFDFTNHDDVKIGDSINKSNYIKANPQYKIYDLKKIPKVTEQFTFGDCFPSYMKFTTPELLNLINNIKDVRVDPESKEQKYSLKFRDVKYTMAKGGLHSEDMSRILKPMSNEILRDADVGSMYPNAIRKRSIFPKHLGPSWLDGYTEVIQQRIKAKALYKETKDKKYQSIQEAFKLALNGGSFGKLGEKTNWQYSPKSGYQVTIGCQIDLLMLIEMLEVGGIKVMSANTDGVVSLFNRDKEEQYKKICKEWEIIVGNSGQGNGELEYADYQLLAQRSVNDYIAIKTDGEVKQKSSFCTNVELHKNKSYLIIAKALDAYYTKGINPRHFISNHENIFDFCAGIRTKGSWYMEARGMVGGVFRQHRLQKTNRYYISNSGYKLIKCNPDGREIQEDAGKWMATIYNKHVERDIKDRNINYDFYVAQVYDIIREIQPEIGGEDCTQLSLF